MNENATAEAKPEKNLIVNQIRCSVCGKQLLNLYPNTLPGMIFATCLSGHKTSYRTDEISRKAV